MLVAVRVRRERGLPAPVDPADPGERRLILVEVGVGDEDRGGARWIGRVNWRWSSTVAAGADGDEHVDLVGLGLDTVATVEARWRGPHREHAPEWPRIPVAHLLGRGDNTLAVTIAAQPAAAEQACRTACSALAARQRPPVQRDPHLACDFGWDWGPESVTAGIWRPIALDRWRRRADRRARRWTAWRVMAAGWTVHADLARRRRCAGSALRSRSATRRTARCAPGATAATVEVEVPDVRRGGRVVTAPAALYGDRHRGAAATAAGRTPGADPGGLPQRRGSTPRPTRTARPFTFVVNGDRSSSSGVNWIPDDVFPHRVTPRPLRRAARRRRSRRASTWCGSGAAGSTRATTSTTRATRAGCWSGRTSCSPAPPTPRRSRCAARSSPRPARASPG